jgi:hypothetical protein
MVHYQNSISVARLQEQLALIPEDYLLQVIIDASGSPCLRFLEPQSGFAGVIDFEKNGAVLPVDDSLILRLNTKGNLVPCGFSSMIEGHKICLA